MSSKIITPTDQPAPSQPVALTQQQFIEIAGAFARLRELNTNTVLDPTAAAEERGLRDFLTKAFFTYGEEFLGSWSTVRNEYRPILRSFALIAQRVGGIVGESQRIQAAAQKEEEAK